MLRILSTLFCSLVLTNAEPARPNILLVVADDMSHAGAYGHQFVKTPHFDSLASQGLRFDRMHTPSSKCAPSRAVMLTGRNPWQLEEAANHQPVWPAKFKSVVESLTDSGYFSGFTGKGWDPGIHPKGRDLTGTRYNDLLMDKLPTKALAAFDYSANFAKFLSDKPQDRPFFFWYGCKEPHRGYEFQSGLKAGKTLASLAFNPSFWGTSDAVRTDILDYALEIEYFDSHLGKILRHLEQSGELENTLIIATSDNSMPFPRYKGHPYEFSTRVPFVVKWPRHIVDPGRTCPEFASFTDIAPTLLEAAGISHKDSGMQPVQGKSLSDFFANRATGRDHLLTGRERNDMCRPNGWGYPVRALHQGDFVYMHNFEPDRWPCGNPEAGFMDTDWGPTKSAILNSGEESKPYQTCFGKRPPQELYNIRTDPECLDNLARHPEHSGHMESMRTALFAELTLQNDPRMLGNGTIFDQYNPERHRLFEDLVETTRKSRKSGAW